MQSVRVIIADPTDLARQGLRGLLLSNEQIEVVASCKTTEEAVRESIAQSPDAVLLGYGFSESERLETVRQIVKSRSWIPVLVLTDHAELDSFLSTIRAGARGYLGGDVDAAGFLNAVQTVSSGGCVVDQVILGDVFQYLAGGKRVSLPDESTDYPAMAKLTPRERELLRLLARGRGNKEIAAMMGISVGTAKTHLRHIFRKLSVSDRTGAVFAALDIDPARLLPAA